MWLRHQVEKAGGQAGKGTTGTPPWERELARKAGRGQGAVGRGCPVCLWPHDPLTLWKKQRDLGSNPSSAPCWRGWMSSSCPRGFCLAIDNRNSTTDFGCWGVGRRNATGEKHVTASKDRVWHTGCGNPALGPFRCSPPSVPHAPISRNLQTPSAGGCGRPAGSHRRPFTSCRLEPWNEGRE